MQGFKNLLKTNQITQESFQNFTKRVEEYRKVTRGPLKKCQALVQNYDTWFITVEKLIFDFHLAEDEQLLQENLSVFLIKFCEKLLLVQKQFVLKLGGRYSEVKSECNDCLRLQTEMYQFLMLKIREYKIKEQAILESHRKYVKLHKSMVLNIQAYKKTFTDVKIIYNREQKVRKYGICEANYQELVAQYEGIQVKLNQITQEQKGIVGLINKMVKQFQNNIIFVGQQAKTFTNTFFQLLYDKQFNQINAINLAIQQLSKIEPQITFSYVLSDLQSEKYLSKVKDRRKSTFIPNAIANIQEIKDESLPQVGGILSIIEKQLGQISKKRKSRNKQIVQFLGLYLKNYQKSTHSHKQILARYNKKKKKFIQFYSISSVFSSSFVSILQQIEQIQQKSIKQFPLKLKVIDNLMNDESKIIEQMQRQFTKYTEKLVNKRDLKKRQSFEKGGIELQAQLKKIDQQAKTEIIERINNVKVVFQQYYDRLKKNSTQLKQHLESVLLNFQKSSIQIYTIIKTSVELKVQEKQISKIAQNQLQQLTKVALAFFQQSIFSALITQQLAKPSFEAQLNKIQEFKKLKKPVQLIQEQKTEKGEENDIKRRQCVKWKQMAYQQQSVACSNEVKVENPKQNENEIIPQKRSKYEEFLNTKISYLPNEKFCESYKCGLAYNIILSGRLFVTNQRLCFHSKLNTKNLFFGETFIEIPKKDIIKIQKRQNAVVFDNSISISTINGEMFFTSFFSRNEAYDTICSTFGINSEDVMYEPQQQVIEQVVQQVIAEEEDDIKEDQIAERKVKIDQNIKKLQYKEAMSTVFTLKNLNALRYFKLFEMNQQISYNRAKYRGFVHFFKTLVGHTEINLEEWSPSIQEYLNSSNIKSNTPLIFTKKHCSVVPVPNSGIPFMPKTSNIQQSMTLHIYSKDKIVIEILVKSSGVPYCDYFVINYKKEIDTIAQNQVSFKFWYNIQFVTQTMMKGVIESKSFQETKMNMKKLEEEMSKYLRYLQRTVSQSTKCQSGNEIEISSSERLGSNQADQQVKQLKDNYEKLSASFETERANNIQLKRMLLVSVLINFGIIVFMLI